MPFLLGFCNNGISLYVGWLSLSSDTTKSKRYSIEKSTPITSYQWFKENRQPFHGRHKVLCKSCIVQQSLLHQQLTQHYVVSQEAFSYCSTSRVRHLPLFIKFPWLLPTSLPKSLQSSIMFALWARFCDGKHTDTVSRCREAQSSASMKSLMQKNGFLTWKAPVSVLQYPPSWLQQNV